MKKVYLILIMTISISIACSSSSDNNNSDKPPSQDLIAVSDMSRVNIPAREHGYSNLQNIVINSTTELNEFIQLIQQQQAWNNKTDFINVLESESLNFNSINLLFYLHTEGSGSIGVSLEEPIWEGENAVVNVTRTDPGIGTADMAYYAYAFKVKKTILKVIFIIGETRVEIPNMSERGDR